MEDYGSHVLKCKSNRGKPCLHTAPVSSMKQKKGVNAAVLGQIGMRNENEWLSGVVPKTCMVLHDQALFFSVV